MFPTPATRTRRGVIISRSYLCTVRSDKNHHRESPSAAKGGGLDIRVHNTEQRGNICGMLLQVALLLLASDLSPETAPRLKVAWTAETHARAPNARAEKIAAFEATPVFSDGQVFVITPF